jgi:hypothetical protein
MPEFAWNCPNLGLLHLQAPQKDHFSQGVQSQPGKHSKTLSKKKSLRFMLSLFNVFASPRSAKGRDGIHQTMILTFWGFLFVCLFVFAVLGLELRAFTLTHSASPFGDGYFFR